MMIYNCLLQQVSHYEFGFGFKFELLWCYTHLVTRVMPMSLDHHSMTWVKVGWINFCIDIKIYHKFYVIG